MVLLLWFFGWEMMIKVVLLFTKWDINLGGSGSSSAALDAFEYPEQAKCNFLKSLLAAGKVHYIFYCNWCKILKTKIRLEARAFMRRLKTNGGERRVYRWSTGDEREQPRWATLWCLARLRDLFGRGKVCKSCSGFRSLLWLPGRESLLHFMSFIGT